MRTLTRLLPGLPLAALMAVAPLAPAAAVTAHARSPRLGSKATRPQVPPCGGP